jgi:hypothetical protein
LKKGHETLKDKKVIIKEFAAWLDVVFLIPGMVLMAIGVFKIYIPAGYIMAGLCFIALAFFIGKKQADIKEQADIKKTGRW